MKGLDASVAQRAKHLGIDPRLRRLAHSGRAAAEVQHRRKPLGRERLERAAEPTGFGFEHRDFDRSPESATMPQSAIVAKEPSASSGLLERHARSKALLEGSWWQPFACASVDPSASASPRRERLSGGYPAQCLLRMERGAVFARPPVRHRPRHPWAAAKVRWRDRYLPCPLGLSANHSLALRAADRGVPNRPLRGSQAR